MSHITRIVHRRANHGQEARCELLLRGMLDACAQTPGALSSTLISPRASGDEFHVIQNFASTEHMQAWSASAAAADWHDRLRDVSDHAPEYRVFATSDVWFSPANSRGPRPPARWRMAIVTWLGIFPTASLFVAFLLPALTPLPFLLRMVLLTALIVASMHYIVMPRLLRLMGRWTTA